MVRCSALPAALVALGSSSCTAFVTPLVTRVPVAPSTTSMSLKGPAGRSSSPINKAASVVGKALFGRPGGVKMGNNNNDGGMMGGGNGNINNGGQGSFDDNEEEGRGMDALAMLGVLATVKDGAGGAWDAYNSALADKPILVKACTSFVGFSIGDFLAQKGTSKESFSYARLARMAAFGFLFHGTISHFFYNALDSALPGTAAMTVIQKVIIDQVFWAPIFTLIFFTWIGVTSGASPSEIVAKVKSDLVQGVVGSWTVWPLAHTINFKFVPTEQRLLYINSIQIFYNVFLSIIGSK
ncbi:conserved unknown protein [Ectocarpus siliculosus]|uniref:Uncharacterized protein n=1 Tax=Ectocarpus siliculosus TaxID=2880 RepID=D8LC10_ECTSI|nr:conserved unknown protein [Ectocarpus siliculosus]|eukprot:CBN79193.1 conserved unknown protein [Ectocarpus siliculosus]